MTHLAVLMILCFAGGCKIQVTTETGRSESTTSTENNASSQTQPTAAEAPRDSIRVMTYNIQYFSAKGLNNGNRVSKIKRILADINPDVVAVQEVADRAAMELLFPPGQWLNVIDDDSPDEQDTGFAVRKPWKIKNFPADLDADDEHFLASGRSNESFFPRRRDALFIEVTDPAGEPVFTAVNIHAKARVGGRATTAPRRNGAAKVLVQKIKTRLAGQNVVLMGDFNDSPDDISLNILETGDPQASSGPNPWPSSFMVNLLQPAWEAGMVTTGANPRRLDKKTGLLNIVYPDARARNHDAIARDTRTGPIIFDQILVSKNLNERVDQKSVTIYQNPEALSGAEGTRPSDHLPVFADIKINR